MKKINIIDNCMHIYYAPRIYMACYHRKER